MLTGKDGITSTPAPTITLEASLDITAEHQTMTAQALTPFPTYSGSNPGYNTCPTSTLDPNDYTSAICIQTRLPQSDLIIPTLIIVAIGLALSVFKWFRSLFI